VGAVATQNGNKHRAKTETKAARNARTTMRETRMTGRKSAILAIVVVQNQNCGFCVGKLNPLLVRHHIHI
jgi:hypothetical protein